MESAQRQLDPAGDEAARTENPAVRVLLIEDNPGEAQLIRHYLERASNVQYQLQVVSGRAEATRALRGAFDVCLLDNYLGECTGLDLIKELDTLRLAGPVIMITGQADADLDRMALEHGLADFLTKDEASSVALDRAIRYARRQFATQQRLSYLAEHDEITALPNRRWFLGRLDQWLSDELPAGGGRHLLYIDLDSFRSVNNSWGNEVGDLVLRHVAAQLRAAAGSGALLARFGGNELVAGVDCPAGMEVEVLARQILAAIRKPLIWEEQPIVVTASMGIGSVESGVRRAQDLIRSAEQAMHAARAAGRDTFKLGRSAAVPSRALGGLEPDLRQALDQEQLRLVYQPQFCLQDGRLTAAEALIRWTHPEHGGIEPAHFVPLAESCGLIRPLTRWSLRTAIAALAGWGDQLPDDFRLAINIAPAQLQDPVFPKKLLALIESQAVPVERVRLEITEAFFVYASAQAQLQALREMGLSIALDDFGTGFSCLSQLARLPIDTLKIDLKFIEHLVEDQRSVRLVRSIISIGEDLGMDVIAEGVESPAQAEILAELGCHYVQGFAYAAGEEQAVFAERLRSRR